MSESKRKYAGGYNGDRYSVSGYYLNDGYFIESKNSITAEVQPVIDLNLSVYIHKYNVSIFRNNEIVFTYIYLLNKHITQNKHEFAVVDELAVNILFQLDETELDRLLPMIKDSTNHSFSLDRKTNTYYIHCQGKDPAIDEFIIHKFTDKFYFDECSLYRKNMSVHKIIRDYSHFSYLSLCHSLSDDDKFLSFSGFYSTWCLLFDSHESVMKSFIKKKAVNTIEEVEEANTIPLQNSEDFYNHAFEMVFSHILSDDYITTAMTSIIEDYDIDPKQYWKDFVRLFDMATI